MQTERTLPHNLDAERAVLAAMLMDREAAVVGVELLDGHGFYSISHQKIFDAVRDINSQPDQVLDLTTLAEELRRRGDLDSVGGLPGLGTILQSTATSANVEYHARIVREKSISRQLIRLCSNLMQRGFEDQGNVQELLEEAESHIFRLAEQRTTRGFVAIGDLLSGILEDIESCYREKNSVTGVATGYAKLDELTSGFQNSNLIILAARPSMGKTAFALNLAQNVAMENKVPVGIFSLEMSADQIIRRILCSEARVDLARVRSGFINRDDFGRLTQAANSLMSAPIYVDDSPGLNINEIRARSRRLISEVKNLGMVVVDYMQLVTTKGRVENRQQEVSLISRSLKALARDLDVPVLALSQLSRAIEKRDDPLPRLSDLRESGAIEQDADVVMFIHRDLPHRKRSEDEEEMGGQESPEESTAKLLIGKQRNGPTGSVDLYFVKQYTRFESMAREYDDSTPF
jgi:replicative DNA helicase